MEDINEAVEYGKGGKAEVLDKEPRLTEVKTNEGLTQDDLLTKKTHIKKDEPFTKADALRE